MTKGILFAAAFAAAVANGGIEIRSDYPGGNVKVLEIDETNGVVRVAPDLRDTHGKWFHYDFTLRGAAGRTLRFQFPEDGYVYLSSLGPAVSKDGGNVDAITASTITSRAFLRAVNAAWQAYSRTQPSQSDTDGVSGATTQDNN